MKLLDYLEKAYYPAKRRKQIKLDVGSKAYAEINFRREAAYTFVCELENLLVKAQQ